MASAGPLCVCASSQLSSSVRKCAVRSGGSPTEDEAAGLCSPRPTWHTEAHGHGVEQQVRYEVRARADSEAWKGGVGGWAAASIDRRLLLSCACPALSRAPRLVAGPGCPLLPPVLASDPSFRTRDARGKSRGSGQAGEDDEADPKIREKKSFLRSGANAEEIRLESPKPKRKRQG